MARWEVEAGRQICFDGTPFISLNREGNARPVEADGAAHFVAKCLNDARMTPEKLYEQQMEHRPRGKPREGYITRDTLRGDRRR